MPAVRVWIAADNARFGQTGPRVGSFDAGFGSAYLARIIGQKKAREIWFLCRQYDAKAALDMGLVNTVVPLADLEATTVQWCREMLALSPTALRMLKLAMNADCDGQTGLMHMAGAVNGRVVALFGPTHPLRKCPPGARWVWRAEELHDPRYELFGRVPTGRFFDRMRLEDIVGAGES